MISRNVGYCLRYLLVIVVFEVILCLKRSMGIIWYCIGEIGSRFIVVCSLEYKFVVFVGVGCG